MPRLAALVLACCAPFGWFAFWSVFHRVPGQDWVVFHTAAALVRAGDWRTLGDPQGFTEVLNRTHRAWMGAPLLFHPWVYPPVTLLLAMAFGWMAYPWSLASFLGVSLAALVAGLWVWGEGARGRALLVGTVLICPAVAFNVGAGQLGFLVAAVVLGGVFLLPRRPVLAGALFGLLCLKPQFALLIPVALVGGRHWRAVGGACVCGVVLVGLSVGVIGYRAWVDWLRLASGVNPARGGLVDAVRVYDQSVHTCLRILGAGGPLAAAGQVLALGVSAWCVWRIFSRPAAPRLRVVVLLCAMVFGAPHVGDYDHVAVAAAAAVVLLGLPGAWEAGLAVGAWVATLFNPPALMAVLGSPVLTGMSALTPLLVLGVMLAGVRRCHGGAG